MSDDVYVMFRSVPVRRTCASIRYRMEDKQFWAVYKFTPRKMDTYISNTGPEIKRLVAGVWVK